MGHLRLVFVTYFCYFVYIYFIFIFVY